ncbi:MAG: hypothetical protein AAB403_23190 [Planctomycetota bacterium]
MELIGAACWLLAGVAAGILGAPYIGVGAVAGGLLGTGAGLAMSIAVPYAMYFLFGGCCGGGGIVSSSYTGPAVEGVGDMWSGALKNGFRRLFNSKANKNKASQSLKPPQPLQQPIA